MSNPTSSMVESNYRTYYGKIFAALMRQFGSNYATQIEDAIQNAFMKSLKNWKPDAIPTHRENWLFIVARNDVLNQLKKVGTLDLDNTTFENPIEYNSSEDLRLKTIMFLAKCRKISSKVKVIYILKNIFGLHIKEISECTLQTQDAIYKCIKRANADFQQEAQYQDFEQAFDNVNNAEISIVEEILYAVFNIGFDSFSEKSNSILNEDLCLEALSHAKILSTKYNKVTTKNLIALCCFHIARIPAKVQDNKIISFFDQDKSKWDNEMISLGFHYLEKPSPLNKYYLEAIITSKHMVAPFDNMELWNEVILLYQSLIKITHSPIAKLNLCYALFKAKRIDEAQNMLETVEIELPNEHIYLSLVKASIADSKTSASTKASLEIVMKTIQQEVRREYIKEHFFMD
jgi:RNA polymerase sigma-70 factor, ECF subfamily